MTKILFLLSTIALVSILLCSVALADYQILLYDVSFSTPPHTIGELPVEGFGLAPRKTVSRINFGIPTVVDSLGALTEQPLYLQGDGSSNYDYSQIQFDLYGHNAFDEIFPKYGFKSDILIELLNEPPNPYIQNNELVVFLDMLESFYRIEFRQNGKIIVQSYGTYGIFDEIGTFEFGIPVELYVELDQDSELLTIYLNGNNVYSAYYQASQLRDMRINLDNSSENIAAVDNIQIYGINDAPTLMLQYPKGNEALLSGKNCQVSWMSSEGIDDVSIEYSLDNGLNWLETEPPNIGNTELYNWLVPDVAANDCFIRIRDRNSNASDICMAPFIIYDLSDTAARTITFDYPEYNIVSLVQQWTEKGMKITIPTAMDRYTSALFYPSNDSGCLLNLSSFNFQTIQPIEAVPFRLISVDLAEYFEEPKTITFEGHKINGSSITQEFIIDGLFDGAGGFDDYQTFNFSADFSELWKVEILTTHFRMDNIVFAFEKTNSIPIADAGQDVTLPADENCEAIVILDGSGSSDADDDELAYYWYYDDQLFDQGIEVETQLPLGEHIFTLIVNDETDDSEPDEIVITVVDNTPPQFSVVMNPSQLWPPNLQMVLLEPEFTLSDNCSDDITFELASITSDEGDQDDYFIDDGVYLRAERDGQGDGRVYILTYRAIDEANNQSLAKASVFVPHNLGQHYTGNLEDKSNVLFINYLAQDLNTDGVVDARDFAKFALRWLDSPCNAEPDNGWCGGADFDQLGSVNVNDLRTFIDAWMVGTAP